MLVSIDSVMQGDPLDGRQTVCLKIREQFSPDVFPERDIRIDRGDFSHRVQIIAEQLHIWNIGTAFRLLDIVDQEAAESIVHITVLDDVRMFEGSVEL